MLIILSGLPGSGKTTLARALAKEIRAVHLRIDTIEQSIRDACGGTVEVGPAGYVVAYRIAEDNLTLGGTVIADSVNGLQITRDAWLSVAARSVARAVEIEVLCSQPDEHRRRVETRASDVPGLTKPTWQEVIERTYEPWTRRPLVIDTARGSVEEIVAGLIDDLGLAQRRAPLAKT